MILLSLLAPHWFLLGLSILALSSSSKSNENGSDANNTYGSIVDKYLKPFDLELHNFPDTGRGIRTLVDRSPGDILLQVPVEDTITAINSVTSTMEYKSLSQEQQLALTLLHLRDQENRYAYVSTILPKDHYAIWNLPGSIWDKLKLPRCYRESYLATRQMVQEFATVGVGDSSWSSDEKMWAFSMVRSRSVAVPELATNTNQEEEPSTVPIALIPGLDLFNHQLDAETLLQLDQPEVDRASTWTLISSKSYSTGDQIYLSYGDEKDNWKLLLTYGFCLPANDPILFWTWQDLLEAAGMVRPSVFSPRVQQSLLQHPQLYETHTVLSEQRATFSYDGKSKEARDSLVTGLQMMENLAVQLGQPQDESLRKDILEQLLENRRCELKASISSVQSVFEESSKETKEWQPFLSSLRLVLEEEFKCIN